jgi:signal transduction histidine kinase/CheY-like chemotaxis protein
MQSAPLPANESARLAALQQLDVLDSAPEAEFEALVKVASLVCGVPISLISLIDSERQWFKANVGLPGVYQTPRDLAFCAHAILDDQLFEVPDATQDPRFFDNPLVTLPPDIRFYAGEPIVLSNGHRIGTLCVIDRQPRQLDDTQREIMRSLAVTAARAMEGRRAMRLQQKNEEALLKSKMLLSRTGALARVGGWEFDLAAGKLHWTDETCRIHGVELGYTPSLAGAIEFYAPDARRVMDAAVQAAIETGQGWDLELPFIRRGGQHMWVRSMCAVECEQGKPVRLVGAFQDITAAHETLQALASAQERIRLATETAGIGIWDLDLASNVATWDAQSYRLFGFDPSDPANSYDLWTRCLHPDDQAATEQALRASIATDDLYSQSYRIIWPDKSIRYLKGYGRVSRNTRGQAIRMVGINVDVTEAAHYAQSLKDARDKAEEASQSKGQFLANMSHEIRTPMNAILGLLSLLQNTELTERQRDYASKTEGAAQSLLGLLNDILDFSKVEAGKMTLEHVPFRLDRLLRNLSVVLSANVGNKGLEVLFDVDPTLPEVLLGDAMRLQQVLINLGGNAIKFTAQGQVVIGLRNAGLSETGVAIEFVVQDSGIGIAPENLDHIFSGFSQAEASTTRRFGGTGLGLAISKRLVALMGGRISIASTLGQGSTFSFTVTLPRVPGTVPELATPVRPSLAARRVLLVEDNPIAGALMLRMVRAWGWPVDLAVSGEQALGLVRAQTAAPGAVFPYEVVYLDWQMPGMDGWETARRLRELSASCPGPQPVMVMVTAHGRETLAQRSQAEQDMLEGFLVKPITASMMYDAVMDAVQGHASVRQTAGGRSSQRRLNGMRILVVEDNLVNQQVAEELLTTEGAIVSMAANGQLGVEAVALAAPQFDAVLMDLQMPVLDGYGATRLIREQLGLTHLPIVAMTANAMASDRDACLAAGMTEHVGKPFDLAHLVSLLIRITGVHPVPSTGAMAGAQRANAVPTAGRGRA